MSGDNTVYAVTQGAGVGCLACWDLSGLTDANDLADALSDFAGLEASVCPKPWEPSRVFRIACHDAVKGTPDYMCDKHPSQDGYVFVARETTGNEPIYSASCRGYLVEDTPHATHADHPMWPKVLRLYSDRLGKIETVGLNNWLVGYLRQHCDAMPFLRKGGLYYVPSWKKSHYMDIVYALRSCSTHALHAGSAMSDVETVRSICESVRSECVIMMSSIREDIRAGKHVQRNIRKLAELRDRMESYSDILGASLDDVTPELESVQLALVQSQLSPEPDEKKKLANPVVALPLPPAVAYPSWQEVSLDHRTDVEQVAQRCAKRYANKGMATYDDLYQEAWIHALPAYRDYWVRASNHTREGLRGWLYQALCRRLSMAGRRVSSPVSFPKKNLPPLIRDGVVRVGEEHIPGRSANYENSAIIQTVLEKVERDYPLGAIALKQDQAATDLAAKLTKYQLTTEIRRQMRAAKAALARNLPDHDDNHS